MTERVIAADGATGLTAEDRWRERCLQAEARVRELEHWEARVKELEAALREDTRPLTTGHPLYDHWLTTLDRARAALKEQDG